jgi:hypothetical protein
MLPSRIFGPVLSVTLCICSHVRTPSSVRRGRWDWEQNLVTGFWDGKGGSPKTRIQSFTGNLSGILSDRSVPLDVGISPARSTFVVASRSAAPEVPACRCIATHLPGCA